MDAGFGSVADAILSELCRDGLGAPGVVAMVTNREDVFYLGAAGVLALGASAPMTLDTIFSLYSCTKAITATAALRLVEEGRLDLDAPAKLYLPEIADLRVVDGFDDSGAPRLRAPKRDITTRMLLLHTSGLTYEWANPTTLRMIEGGHMPSHRLGTRASYRAHLLFDPGERWEYGIGVDWCGFIVEAIMGERLDALVKARVFEPLGMRETGWTIPAGLLGRRAAIHQRDADGVLRPLPLEPPRETEAIGGGGGLHGTVGDYMRFLRMWLNDGRGENGQVLRPETVAMASRDGLNGLKVRPLPSAIPRIANEVDIFPGLSKSWALSFLVNDEIAPTGRPAGSLAWAGLGNLFYWIDRDHGVAGFWATQILPFLDPASYGGFLAFETAVYQSLLTDDSRHCGHPVRD